MTVDAEPPPHNIEAEQAVLGAALISQDAIGDVQGRLRADDFYRPAHQIIFDAMTSMYASGEALDSLTLFNHLRKKGKIGRVGGAEYLHHLSSIVRTSVNIGYHANMVREEALKRRLIEAGHRLISYGHSAEDSEVIAEEALKEIQAATEERLEESYQRLGEAFPEALEKISAFGTAGNAVMTGFPDLDRLTRGLKGGQVIVVAARPAVGKALALDTPLPTPTGWTTMGQVQPGEYLIGADGKPVLVAAATEVMHGRPCYEVEFDDGTVIVADAQHQWLTDTRASRRSAQAPGIRTTEEIAATLRCNTTDRRLNHTVVNAKPLNLPDRDLLIPPYALGVWLGDGNSNSARFTTGDPEIAGYIAAEGLRVEGRGGLMYTMQLPLPEPIAERSCIVCEAPFVPQTNQVRTCGRVCGGKSRKTAYGPSEPPRCPDCGESSSGLRQCQACRDDHGTVQALLRKLGVLGDKHIPAEYLRASEEQRRALLAGLLDTDGYVNRRGTVQFAVTSRRLAEDAWELILSLGYKASWTSKPVQGRTEDSSTCYMITFTPSEKVFRLARKNARVNTDVHPKATYRNIVDVRPVASVPVRCVEVDNGEHMYLAGRTWVPTHNSTLGLDIARNAAKNDDPSAVFSLEMDQTEIITRLLSAEARVAMDKINAGLVSEEEWGRIAGRIEAMSDVPLFLDDSADLDMGQIRAKCRRLKQQHGLRLVVIDYLQLLETGGKVESRQVEVSQLSRSMKKLAKELDIVIVLISQLNRGPEQRQDKKPMMSDLRESGSVEQDADQVWLLFRMDLYEPEQRVGEADVIVAKHRNGQTATVTLFFQGHYSRFVSAAN